MKKRIKAFTLIEILVVVGLIAILAAVTIVAINPAKNFADTRNAQRSSDVTALLNAVTQYTSEENQALGDLGTIPPCTGEPAAIGSGTGNVNLSTTLVDEYLVAIPDDPSEATTEDSGYTICETGSGRVQISAPHAENEATIAVQR